MTKVLGLESTPDRFLRSWSWLRTWFWSQGKSLIS